MLSPTVLHGDCLDVLPTLPDASVQCVITDPPYGLSSTDQRHVVQALGAWLSGDRAFVPTVSGGGFMGMDWDSFVPPPAVWDECFRILKPGGIMAVFAGARTHDLMTLSIRLAGFEIRDSIAWLNAQGMPKGLNIERAAAKAGRDGSAFSDWNTSLRPANEPIIIARKPSSATSVSTMLDHGTGAFNIGATRIEAEGRPHRVAGIRNEGSPMYRARRPKEVEPMESPILVGGPATLC